LEITHHGGSLVPVLDLGLPILGHLGHRDDAREVRGDFLERRVRVGSAVAGRPECPGRAGGGNQQGRQPGSRPETFPRAYVHGFMPLSLETFLVPTLRVGTPNWTLCVAVGSAPPVPFCLGTRSVRGAVPTRSVGTRGCFFAFAYWTTTGVGCRVRRVMASTMGA